MDITYDPAKNASNLAKHGVPLSLAAGIDWSDVWCYVDDRHDYGEVREIGFAMMGTRLYCVVFTQRGKTMHIISLRKANPREVRHVQESQD